MTLDATVPTDVVIVGAGFAGLSSALRLSEAGLSVRVVEAAERVGGRTASGFTADGQWLELGGQWVAERHVRLRALIERFSLRTEPTGTPGRIVSLEGGRRVERETGYDRRSLLARGDREAVDAATAAFARIVDAVDMARPWQTPDAALLDETTFAAWIRSTLPTEAAREYFTTSCEAIFAPDPREVSLLHAAYYFRSGDHIDGLLGIDRSAQEERVVGGASVVCDAIAAHLGDRVITGAPVRGIHQGDDGVRVETRDGAFHRADRVIVTLAPAMADRLEYTPLLPSARDQLSQRLHAIAVVKLSLVYDRPFWREDGLSGEAVVDEGPIRVILDNTPRGYEGGVLVAFIEGADKIEHGLNTADQRRDAFVDLARRLFGDIAAHPREYLERDWAMQEFARGCYGGHFAPGTWLAYGPALTAPIGRLHWAGTETAAEWTGYMEGAIASGYRAADEVLAAIGRPADDDLPTTEEERS